jgi:hypothetical protein
VLIGASRRLAAADAAATQAAAADSAADESSCCADAGRVTYKYRTRGSEHHTDDISKTSAADVDFHWWSDVFKSAFGEQDRDTAIDAVSELTKF